MKTDPTHAKKLTALVRSLKRRFKPAAPPEVDPVTQLVIAFLEWNASHRQAELAHQRIMQLVVDNNDLRVSHTHELVRMIGEDYPMVEQRAARMRESLQDIYIREHAVSLQGLKDRAKKEVRAYLDSLGGIPQYVAAQVVLVSFGGHAVPVDDKLAGLLVEEGVAPEGASLLEVAAFLERQIKAADAVLTHQLLRAWADSKRRRGESVAKSVGGPSPRSAARPPSAKKKK